MPKSLIYRPVLIDGLITNQRIGSYAKVFNTQNDLELMGVYLWNLSVCAALYPLVSSAEVTLRNAIDGALTADIGRFWWKKTKLHYKSFVPNTDAPYPVNFLYGNFASAHKQVIKDARIRHQRSNHTPLHHEVVAKTEFSTWEYVLDAEFMGNNLIWPKNLGKVFTGPWPSQQASTTLTYLKDLVTTVREFRNRVFHHEPAWKRFGVLNEADALAHLVEKIRKIEELITLISPEKTELLRKNGILQRAYSACTSAEIRRHQHSGVIHKVASMSKLAHVVELAQLNSSIEKICIYGKAKRVFTIS
jgi:hypothetical protein